MHHKENPLFSAISKFLEYSDSNTIKDSKIGDNSERGIHLKSAGQSSANQIYNNFFNNTNNIYFESQVYSNFFNTTKQSGSRIYSSGNEIGGAACGRRSRPHLLVRLLFLLGHWIRLACAAASSEEFVVILFIFRESLCHGQGIEGRLIPEKTGHPDEELLK